MRLALFLDNCGIAPLGPLPSPSTGNPGIGGTEYAFLALAQLLQGSELEPYLLLTAPQLIEGIRPAAVQVVPDLVEALRWAEQSDATAFVFRPGALAAEAWAALQATRMPLLAWFHNLGCHQQARTEALPALRGWVLVSGAQLDVFRHSRLARHARVIPNPVAVPPSFAGPRPWQQAEAALDLAYVGAMTPFKGFDRLAARWGTIAAACPDSRLLVFGGADLYGARSGQGQFSPYEHHCRRLLNAGGHGDRVVFLGSQGLERYEALSTVAVGVVNPSGCDETFCLSAAEFSACGIPVVTARRNALIQTVRDQRTGLLARSDQELAQHCIGLLQHPEQAWALGQAGQVYVSQAFSAERVREAWIALARDIASGDPLVSPAPSTPWYHEQRWLRQLWGAFLVIPGWPSWPTVKAVIKRILQGGDMTLKPRGVGLLAGLVALLVWALLVFGKYGGNPTGLARIGDQLPRSPLLRGQALVVLKGKRGNDGQQFLTLALDPFQFDPGTSAALDNPIYRGKRLVYPLCAWLVGLGQPGLIVWTLGLINVASIGIAAALVSSWAQIHQRSPQWGLAVLALPGYWVTLSLDTADLLATTLMLASALAWQQQSLRCSLLSLSGALLTRETALLAWAATGLSALREHLWRWLIPLAFVPLPLWLWTAHLRVRFPAVPDATLASLHFTWPFAGILRKAMQLLGLSAFPGLDLSFTEHVFDSLCFLLWCATLALLLVGAVSAGYARWLRSAAALYLLPGICTSTQILARFPDYTRVWIDLSSLAMLLVIVRPGWFSKAWIAISGVISIGYLAGYLFAS